MRNFLKLVVLISLVTVAGAASFVFFTDKEVVVLNNGTVKTVDQTWESSGSIFYEINDEIFLLDKNEIKSHGKRNLTHLFLDIKTTIVQNFNEIEKIAYRFLEKKKISVDRKITGPLVLMGLLFFLLIPLLAKRFIKRNPKAAKKRKAAVLSQEAKDEFPTRLDIVRFFLNLFKLQIEADDDAAAEFVPLISKTSRSNPHIMNCV